MRTYGRVLFDSLELAMPMDTATHKRERVEECRIVASRVV